MSSLATTAWEKRGAPRVSLLLPFFPEIRLLLRMLCCASAKPRLLSGICIHFALRHDVESQKYVNVLDIYYSCCCLQIHVNHLNFINESVFFEWLMICLVFLNCYCCACSVVQVQSRVYSRASAFTSHRDTTSNLKNTPIFLIYIIHVVVCEYMSTISNTCQPGKTRRKWQKRNLVSGGRLRGSQLGRAMNWVDRLRTSADEQL